MEPVRRRQPTVQVLALASSEASPELTAKRVPGSHPAQARAKRRPAISCGWFKPRRSGYWPARSVTATRSDRPAVAARRPRRAVGGTAASRPCLQKGAVCLSASDGRAVATSTRQACWMGRNTGYLSSHPTRRNPKVVGVPAARAGSGRSHTTVYKASSGTAAPLLGQVLQHQLSARFWWWRRPDQGTDRGRSVTSTTSRASSVQHRECSRQRLRCVSSVKLRPRPRPRPKDSARLGHTQQDQRGYLAVSIWAIQVLSSLIASARETVTPPAVAAAE